MKNCKVCGKPFDVEEKSNDPAVLAGIILAQEKYGDAGEVCLDCLSSRGRLAMMYDPEVFD